MNTIQLVFSRARRHMVVCSGLVGILAIALGAVSFAHATPARQTVSVDTAPHDTALFAGGCFWSMQKAFDHIPGVVATTAGFAGGHVANPSYEQVETGTTGHAESVQVVYDPSKVNYAQLVNTYLHSIDPTDGGGTFCDRGPQYRPIVFVRDSIQRRVAESSKAAIAKYFSAPIAVQVTTVAPFYPAEEYHQEFYQKNPVRYEMYRVGCGRDAALAEAWKNAAAK